MLISRILLVTLSLSSSLLTTPAVSKEINFGGGWPAVTMSDSSGSSPTANEILTGADQLETYLPKLKGKRVGVLVNHTAIVKGKPIVDILVQQGVDIKLIFGPEHGFRGNASNGADVGDEVDPVTGIPVVSLYGKKTKPSKEDLDKIDILLFDFQDVGCRFYTNINKLRDVMDVCAEHGKKILILDRPNPNAYVDGPILEMENQSGIGQFPIPMTHGMTIGEFAQMINGEGWTTNKLKCDIDIVPVKNWTHDMYYELPTGPSPNLSTQESVILYPTLCMFEGTILSQGRGTEIPFTVLGSPALKGRFEFSFLPRSLPGKSETPLHMNEPCYGVDFRKADLRAIHKSGKVNLQVMIQMYQAYPEKEKFFDRSYSTQIGNIAGLVGTKKFKEQIIAGATEEEIRKSWEPGLSNYKEMRKKYLIYP